MTHETRQCRNCKAQFVIETDDFEFYRRLKVPPPTFCPKCRLQRRLAARNERTLYKRACDLCKKDTVSMYSSDKPYTVYCHECWYSDKWDSLSFGIEFSKDKPALAQFYELWRKVPRPALRIMKSLRSSYCNQVLNLKNCYLVISAANLEDCYYGYRLFDSKDCFDTTTTWDSELIYDSVDILRSSRVFYSQSIEDSQEVYLSYDLRNCSNCLGCVGLRNKNHHIFNKPYTKEGYERRLDELSVQGWEGFLKARKEFERFKMQRIRKFADIFRSENVSGNYVDNSRNCISCFDADNVEDSKHLFVAVKGGKDLYDFSPGGLGSELCYETTSCITSNVTGFTAEVRAVNNVFYSVDCVDSSNLFLCVGLMSKEYCILNKRYSKEDYETLRSDIIRYMNDVPYTDKRGRAYPFGEFFPIELSPFFYNESMAQEYFPLTKDQIEEKGYMWKDPEKRDYQITMPNNQLPDSIKDVSDDILKENIECAHASANLSAKASAAVGVLAKAGEGKCDEKCTVAFRVVSQELEFLRKMQIPLPRLCPNCRHYRRLKKRNPLHLWRRNCECAGKQSDNGVYKNAVSHFHESDHCPNEFETTYPLERKDIVYCEACYNSEVS